MNVSSSKPSKSNISKDIWFDGVGDTFEEGRVTYFICEYKDNYYYDDVEKKFIVLCKYKNKPLTDIASECNMNCDMYGRCQTCNGFSAVRCSECEIPRP